MRVLPVIVASVPMLLPVASSGMLPDELISNPGFEVAENGKAAGWSPAYKGYEIDENVHHRGARSIRCVNTSADDMRGATYGVTLNQSEPRPVLFTGWSRAASVGGSTDADYSLYLDLEFTDGSPFYGQIAPFAAGTHDWQRKDLLVVPARPLRRATVYALFRSHIGTAWFDDFSVTEVQGDQFFDSQAIAPPRLPAGASHAWFVRDVEAKSGVLPLAADGSNSTLSLRLVTRPGKPDAVEEAILTDTTGRSRAVTAYYVERFAGSDALWWNDIRQAIPAGLSGERVNMTRVGVGATGTISVYPFGCVTQVKRGRAVGMPPSLGPRVSRIGYNAKAGLLYAAFDVALTPDNVANRDAEGHGTAKLAVAAFDVDPAWGFRSAAERFYRLFPEDFDRRAKADGIWMPFTDPSTIDRPQDFHIAYHEGLNSLAADDKLGILSFQYTEPMTWWMPMPREIPRTYDAALKVAREFANSKDEGLKRTGQALFNSGSWDENGKLNVTYADRPWSNGALWILNPSPYLPNSASLWTKYRVNYTPEYVAHMYGSDSPGVQDGEYLDSLEGWGDMPDYRPESIRYSHVPPTFASETYRPLITTWFSVWEYAAAIRADMRKRGKLLMANGTPWHKFDFLPLLDVAGTETDWSPGGAWRPDSDAVFNLRRTLSYRKPYLLLQNTTFEKFGTDRVEKYFQRSMFYGCFPSMFSPDAANHRYWETPALYNRDRPLFKRYIPAIQKLSAAGWEPITYARSDNPIVYVERYGDRLFTVLNDSEASASAVITVELGRLGVGLAAPLRVIDLVTQEVVASQPVQRMARIELTLKPGEGRALRLEPGK